MSLIAFGFFVTSASTFAQEQRPVVYVAPIEDIIDLGLAPFGGRVDAVSEGELIDAGQVVEVTRVDGNRFVVRRLPHIN